MNDKKSVEKFLLDIDCDLLQYEGELRKKGFTFSLSARYLAEEDLHFCQGSKLSGSCFDSVKQKLNLGKINDASHYVLYKRLTTIMAWLFLFCTQKLRGWSIF